MNRDSSRVSHAYPRDIAPMNLKLRGPVLVLVLAATAVPIEWRALSHVQLGLDVHPLDLAANVVGYVPVGLLLRPLGLARAMATAAAMTLSAEGGQFFMAHRDPSIADVAANLLGAGLGLLLFPLFGRRTLELRLRRWHAPVAAIGLAAIGAGVWLESGLPTNQRGLTEPGTLEGYWTFDRGAGRNVADASGHVLGGRFTPDPVYVAGVRGAAASFGTNRYVQLNPSSAFRLAGSMTVSAWINSSAFHEDDAAVVSNHVNHGVHDGAGFQLDTTVDTGPRTIGFKMFDACGALVARYGRTPLKLNTWYYVAGVYDARRRRLDVYLNGAPDDGVLTGSIPGAQRSSRAPTYLGHRPNEARFDFSGAIDEVRVYSAALDDAAIAADMRGDSPALDANDRTSIAPALHAPAELSSADATCPQSEYEDARLPLAAAAVGMFTAVLVAGAFPRAPRAVLLMSGLAGGLILLPAASSTLTAISWWSLTLSAAAGAASIAASRD